MVLHAARPPLHRQTASGLDGLICCSAPRLPGSQPDSLFCVSPRVGRRVPTFAVVLKSKLARCSVRSKRSVSELSVVPRDVTAVNPPPPLPLNRLLILKQFCFCCCRGFPGR